MGYFRKCGYPLESREESESEEVSEEEYHGCILMTEIEPGEGDY